MGSNGGGGGAQPQARAAAASMAQEVLALAQVAGGGALAHVHGNERSSRCPLAAQTKARGWGSALPLRVVKFS